MSAMTLNVRVSGSLGDHVAENVGADGLYENVSEYVRDLIRRDKVRADEERFRALKAELQRAFETPIENYVVTTAADVIARGRVRHRH